MLGSVKLGVITHIHFPNWKLQSETNLVFLTFNNEKLTAPLAVLNINRFITEGVLKMMCNYFKIILNHKKKKKKNR